MDEFEKIYQEKVNRDNNLEQLPEPPVRDSRLGKRKRGHLDWPLVVLVLLILAIGTIMVLSSSYAREYYEGNDFLKTFRSQMVFAAAGIFFMFVASMFSPKTYHKFAVSILVIAGVLLALVITPFGVTMNGARRWLKLGITFQPDRKSTL